MNVPRGVPPTADGCVVGAATGELSDDELEHVFGGLARPYLGDDSALAVRRTMESPAPASPALVA